jgi:hypothetical protein
MSNLIGKKIYRKKTGEGQLEVTKRCIPRWYNGFQEKGVINGVVDECVCVGACVQSTN